MRFLTSLVITLNISCNHSANLDQQIIGIWTLDKVYEYDNDVSEKHNPKNNRWIEFKADGSFVSDGDPFGPNAGRWTTDNESSVLYIDSDVDDDDSEWKVTFAGNQVFWTGIGHPRKENTRLVHTRTPSP